jgi:putative transposase
MPYVRIWVHLVWSTKGRTRILIDGFKEQLFAHIIENAARKDIRLDCINGTVDHVHCLILLQADQSVSKVMQLIKGESSRWANVSRLIKTHFEWQDEYFACSVCESEVARVRRYIGNQEEHHRQKTFAEEYEGLLREHGFQMVKEG